ncbi:MAG: aspartate kinase [Conexivisphaerales archaeon]
MNRLSEIVVVKVGGSVLNGEDDVKKVVDLTDKLRKEGKGVVLVVSAMKGVTDSLLSSALKINPDISHEKLDEILSVGEITSARLLGAALERNSFQAVVIEPQSELWPIITDSKHLDANPLIEKTRERVRSLILPLIEDGKIPVICGFLGKTQDGKITTLGRGGSDTTAVLVGNCIGASEVLLVKDVSGVFSSDPDLVENSKFIEVLDGDEAGLLAKGGAKFLHQKALRYQKEGMNIRITALDSPSSGTLIRGKEPQLSVERYDQPISMLTLVGVNTEDMGVLTRVTEAVTESGSGILAILLEKKSALIYVTDGRAGLNRIHDRLIGERLAKAISSFDGLAMVVVKGDALESRPGIIEKITRPLASKEINIYGMVTISSSIRIFVSSDKVEEVVSAAKEAIEEQVK